MYKILIVDDEAKIRELIKKYLVFEGKEPYEAENGMRAVELCRGGDFDLIIMDAMMPELDGFSAVKKIRETSAVPVIMLSARGEEYDRIHGFELGVDDYVVKPFSPKELMMRIDAVLSRVRPQLPAETAAPPHEIFEAGGLKVDFTARLVYVDGEKKDLSPREYDLLFYMIKNRNIALSREKILTDVWGYDFYGDDRTLDTHIKLLRKSLGKSKGLIVTLRGTGYRFEA
ncbi:MAG: response regulator transcription factor [Oscillospiraceae bacterium]|jgi:DNA-binding response OmpR family regulator|nr:response regulator transcription factor [Oscillospiraceae bacterium]